MNKSLLLLCWLLCLQIGITQAQTEQSDSLWNVWQDEEEVDSLRVEALLGYFPISPIAQQPDSIFQLAAMAFELAESQGSPYLMAKTLQQQGRALFYQTRFKESLPYFERAQELCLKTKDSTLIAGNLHNLAATTYELGQFQEAEPLAKEALSLQRLIGDSAGMAKSLGTLANQYTDQGKYADAIDMGKQAAVIFAAIGDSLFYTRVLGNIGNTYLYLGEYDSALIYKEIALQAFQTMRDPAGQAVSYSGIGNIKMQQGDMQAALENHELSRQKYEEAGQIQGAAIALASMGNIHVRLKNYPLALEQMQAASLIFEAQQNPANQSVCLVGIGDIYKDVGEIDKAFENYETALRLRQELGMQFSITEAMSRIGFLHFEEDNLTEAMQIYQQSMAISDSIGDQKGVAASLANIGSIYRVQGAYEEALRNFDKSLRIQEQINTEQGLGLLQYEMAESYRALGRITEAKAMAEKGLWSSQQTQDLATQHMLSFLLYEINKEQSNAPEALRMHELYHSLQDSIDREENQRAIFQFEYEQKALQDSLNHVQQQAETELTYQQQLSRRNYLLFGGIGLALLMVIFLRYQQQLRNREKELELQRERERKQQLQELDALKTNFFTNISHEFRTPLTVILGMAGQLPEAYQETSSLIRRNGRRLLRLINQLLDLSRLESQEIQLNLSQGDLVRFTRYLTQSFESLATDRNIQLSFEGPATAVIADYDAEKVQDVLYNLLSNALKYTPSGGKVEVKVRQQHFQDQAFFACEVQDDGPGIVPEDLPRIFDRFYQGSATSRDESTGIGLALAKGLTERMGGRLEASSQIGQGSSFTLLLPIVRNDQTPVGIDFEEAELVSPTEEAVPHLVLPEIESADQPQVLIIEDNPDVITYLSAILGGTYQLLTAQDGQTGIELAQERVPDLIVCDVMMPIKDGFEVTEILKTDARTSHIPIIMLTAKATQQDKLAGLKHGADAYLTKPFDREELLVRIENLLEVRNSMQAYYLNRLPQLETPVAPPTPPSLDDIFLEKIRTCIEEQMAESNLSVQDLCEVVHLSHTQTYRKIKALTGLTPTLLIRSLRLQRGKQLLETTPLTISEVAYDVGFNDPNYFSRVFIKEFGLTPTELRDGKK